MRFLVHCSPHIVICVGFVRGQGGSIAVIGVRELFGECLHWLADIIDRLGNYFRSVVDLLWGNQSYRWHWSGWPLQQVHKHFTLPIALLFFFSQPLRSFVTTTFGQS